MKKTFQQRLRELRGDSTRAEFAKFLGIQAKTYEHYEYGTRKPTLALILQLVGRCGVTSDFLLGISDVVEPIPHYAGTEGGEFCHGCRLIRALEERVEKLEQGKASP